MPSTGDIVRASDFEAIKPQLSIGTVTTGAAGSNASASVTGTSPNFKLNLTIPRGNTGATGATGPQGPSGTYTGPLKPTSSYWRSAVANGGAVQIPSGGTWAWFISTTMNTGFQHGRINVSAGGTTITRIPGSNATDIAYDVASTQTLCWRIQ